MISLISSDKRSAFPIALPSLSFAAWTTALQFRVARRDQWNNESERRIRKLHLFDERVEWRRGVDAAGSHRIRNVRFTDNEKFHAQHRAVDRLRGANHPVGDFFHGERDGWTSERVEKGQDEFNRLD